MKELFRKKARENYKEQFSIDRQITKIPFSFCMISVIFVLGIVSFMLWLVYGNIVSTVSLTGVVYPGDSIKSITTSRQGIVSEIIVEKGDSVEPGDIVAIMPDEEILDKIEEGEKNNIDKDTIELLRKEYENNSVIESNTSGIVMSVASAGKFAEKGSEIITVASNKKDENKRQIFAFLPTKQKGNIEIGCTVQVSPNYASREKYGYINGYVAEIEKEIITKSDAENQFNIYNIPELMDENETYICVHINLLADENTESGLSWSNAKSGAIDVEMGTICEGSVVISEKPPYKWILGGGL